MSFERQVEVYRHIEALLNNGHTMSTLPIDKERVMGIISLRTEASEQDLQVLRLAVGSPAVTTTPTFQK